MTDDSKQSHEGLVHHRGGALAARSGGLLRRGLDLLTASAWDSIEFSSLDFLPGASSVSSAGLVARGGEPGPDNVLDIFSPLGKQQGVRISSPVPLDPDFPDRPPFKNTLQLSTWSPSGRYLFTEWESWGSRGRLVDVHGARFLGSLGDDFYRGFAWSRDGRFLAAYGYYALITIWELSKVESSGGELLRGFRLVAELDRSTAASRGMDGMQFVWAVDFQPSGRRLAVTCMDLESRDELFLHIAILDASSLVEVERVRYGSDRCVTSLSWTSDGSSLVATREDGAVGLVRFKQSGAVESTQKLLVVAQRCRCHPFRALCAFAGAAKGRGADTALLPEVVSILDLATGSLVDSRESPSGVADLCWSASGAELYVLQKRGPFLVYRLPAPVLAQ